MTSGFPFQDCELSFEERAADLVSRLTLEEKIGQMIYTSPAVERFDIPEYNWWNECLHGVGRAGIATVFPQAIGLASIFDEDFMRKVATAISDEARAKHHLSASRGDRRIYKGLTYWTPNINIFRDPRWGRGHETYGECPYLTARLGVGFVQGLQGADPKYLKLVATPKHFAVHSGPEGKRHSFNAVVDNRDLWETYLPAFRATVLEADAWSIMGAYNRTNDEPCCGSKLLLIDILRETWKFQGYVVSDCWAIQDFHEHHEVTKTPAESAALAVKMGCDLNCGRTYPTLKDAVANGLVSEADIDRCVQRLMTARMKLGMFDDPNDVEYTKVDFDVVDCPEHRELSRVAAVKSLVLLKNQDQVLPLGKGMRRILVVGPNADDKKVLLGNYNGTPSQSVTPLEGIRAHAPKTAEVLYQPGCHWTGGVNTAIEEVTKEFTEAIVAAEQSDVVVLCLGLNSQMEGEQGDASNSDAAGDRVHIGLPEVQEMLLKQMVATGKPVVVVMMSGSAVAMPFAAENAAAIIQQFYPGQEGGTALAQALFGEENPGGRLPVTIYRSDSDLPDFEDYSMENRTYRFFQGEPLYPFGFGLSYTVFEYENLSPSTDQVTIGDGVTVKVTVKNVGNHAGEEVVQIYTSHQSPNSRAPIHQLAGFMRLSMYQGEEREVEFFLDARQLALVDENGDHVLNPGTIRIHAGGSQPDAISQKLGAAQGLSIDLKLAGEPMTLAR